MIFSLSSSEISSGDSHFLTYPYLPLHLGRPQTDQGRPRPIARTATGEGVTITVDNRNFTGVYGYDLNIRALHVFEIVILRGIFTVVP
jgi:hypothetical protein